MTRYNHSEVESRWGTLWFRDNIYRAQDFSEKTKKYILVEFPYPSGSGLHCGHVFRFTLPDVYARKLRMSGYNVLFPIGWDAFGLPAENYAVTTGIHPAITTRKAIETFTSQMKMLGYGFDWEREVDTTDPSYYRWTQWIFLRLWERGLAELKEQPVWWCDALKTVLAHEEVLEDEKGNKISERGEHPVEKRMLRQWVLKMPKYAEKLLDGLNNIDFPESVRSAQSNWIGKSIGASIKFSVQTEQREVFTTRPDTILGVTFMVVAPEHPIIEKLLHLITNAEEVRRYCEETKNRSDLERKADKTKSGIKLSGVLATNPLVPDKNNIPIFVADYVLMDYGTGAIMGVPAHDERDYQFAKQYNLPIIQTVISSETTKEDPLPLTIESGFISITEDIRRIFGATRTATNKAISCHEMTEKVISILENEGTGERRVTYRIRDWLFSRQRYWGEPIPLVHCQDETVEPVTKTDSPDCTKKLPVPLPDVPDYLPSSDSISPLANNKEWLNTTDSKGRPATRETNTMPNWAGSCWYFLRYIDPKNDNRFASEEKLKYWLPVDRYFGGSEHTTLHLLYSRFWHIFLYDEGLVPTPEPYAWRLNGGILLGADGQKMSKSVGNVVNPDEKIKLYGADSLRLFICFMGPYDGTLPWSENGLKACRKVVERIHALKGKISDTTNSDEVVHSYHKYIKRITNMLDNLKGNTSVSEIMIFLKSLEAAPHVNREIWLGFLKSIAPFCPFLAEELWQETNSYKSWDSKNSVHLQSWPTYNEDLAKDDVITIGIQVNGKLRDQLEIHIEESEDSIREKALTLPGLKKWIEGKQIKKFVYVKGRIISIVVA